MKQSKPIKIDNKDFARVVLTDLLPYETPLIFSNRHFHERITKDKLKNAFIKELFKATADPSIPYTYNASRGDLGNRELSILHPRQQLKIIDFYRLYYSMILDRCSLSEFSLRAPNKVASRFYESALVKDSDELISGDVDSKESGFSPQSKYATSFFTYRKYNRLYQFFDSNEFLEIEKSYDRYLSLDVSKCFYNIYTHSIAWAVKNKHFSKKTTLTSSFENKFDELMRNCNFGETNGIVVGPEISRIFSEIIFQRIDSNVKNNLLGKFNLSHSTDYVIRRYIDDIYIFTNSQQVENAIKEQYQTELAKYKLYLNSSKNTHLIRPFYTNISSAKDRLISKVDDFFEASLVRFEGGGNMVNKDVNFRRLTSSLIAGYKDAANLKGVGYTNISAIFLGVLRKRILDFSRNIVCNISREQEYDAVSSFCLEISRVLHFVLATDIKNRNVDLCYQSLILLHENLTHYAPVLNQVFSRSAEDGFVSIFASTTGSKNLGENSIEFISSLMVIAYISPFFEVPESLLTSLWEASKTELEDKFGDDFPYLEAVCLLFYSKHKSQYSNLRQALVSDLQNSISNGGLPHSTSTFMGFLDFCACPYVDEKSKKALITEAWMSLHNSRPKDSSKLKPILTALEELPWFIDWSMQAIDIRKTLFRKELQNVY